MIVILNYQLRNQLSQLWGIPGARGTFYMTDSDMESILAWGFV